MAGRADIAERRRSRRSGRERGYWTYIPGEELEKMGFSTDEAAPLYKTWPGRKGTIMIQLYRRES